MANRGNVGSIEVSNMASWRPSERFLTAVSLIMKPHNCMNDHQMERRLYIGGYLKNTKIGSSESNLILSRK